MIPKITNEKSFMSGIIFKSSLPNWGGNVGYPIWDICLSLFDVYYGPWKLLLNVDPGYQKTLSGSLSWDLIRDEYREEGQDQLRKTYAPPSRRSYVLYILCRIACLWWKKIDTIFIIVLHELRRLRLKCWTLFRLYSICCSFKYSF